MSNEQTNALTLGVNPFYMQFQPLNLLPFGAANWPTNMASDGPQQTQQMLAMGYNTLNVYAGKVTIKIVVTGQHDFATPIQWYIACHTFPIEFDPNLLTTDTADARRRLAENGIKVAVIDGLAAGKPQNNVYVYKRFFTRAGILRHAPDDPNVRAENYSAPTSTDSVYTAYSMSARQELNPAAAATHLQAQALRFRVYLKIKQYQRWQKSNIESIQT